MIRGGRGIGHPGVTTLRREPTAALTNRQEKSSLTPILWSFAQEVRKAGL